MQFTTVDSEPQFTANAAIYNDSILCSFSFLTPSSKSQKKDENTPLQTLADCCQHVEKDVSIETLGRKWNAN
jgi:hypothetical protein